MCVGSRSMLHNTLGAMAICRVTGTTRMIKDACGLYTVDACEPPTTSTPENSAMRTAEVTVIIFISSAHLMRYIIA